MADTELIELTKNPITETKFNFKKETPSPPKKLEQKHKTPNCNWQKTEPIYPKQLQKDNKPFIKNKQFDGIGEEPVIQMLAAKLADSQKPTDEFDSPHYRTFLYGANVSIFDWLKNKSDFFSFCSPFLILATKGNEKPPKQTPKEPPISLNEIMEIDFITVFFF